MSSPITSVPEPAEGGSSSSDPLAGVITQVSPRQAAAPLRGGPARPTKVAKQGTSKAASAEKKKKKKTASVGGQDSTDKEDVERSVDEAGEAKTTSEDASTQQLAAEREISASHSQNPSSTLIGTMTTQPSTLTAKDSKDGLSNEKPADAAMTPTEPDPTVADVGSRGSAHARQDMTEAAKQLSSKSSPSMKATGDKMEMMDKKPAAKASTAAATNPDASRGQKKTGLMAKIVAILTCSSAAGAMVAADAQDEKSAGKAKSTSKSQAPNGKATKGDAKKISRPRQLPASRRGSVERSGTGTSTPGGGTVLSKEETGDVMSGAVVPPGSSFVPQEADHTGKRGAVALGGVAANKHDDSEDEDEGEEEEWLGDDLQDIADQTEEQRLIQQGGAGIPKDEQGNPQPLLEPIGAEDKGRKCLVLDLDETLVHSSFKMISNADFIVPVEIEGTVHNVYVIKRPGVDEFMRQMGEIYEVVVFTASLAKYADPVLDILDIHHVVRHRLFRESCYNHKGNYVKDLSQLGREIHTSIIIDNSPASYIFHPNNAVPISSWFNDPHDTELTDLCPFLAELADVDDVRAVLDAVL